MSTVEYALIVVAVVAVVGAGAAMIGGAFDGLFITLESYIQAAKADVKTQGGTGGTTTGGTTTGGTTTGG
ncbi:MAG: hypothetical protein F4169_22165, partial [Gammaproteobacteria bacterium]|nr:hypothetical protein [Gammaproteobacteria bacterium]